MDQLLSQLRKLFVRGLLSPLQIKYRLIDAFPAMADEGIDKIVDKITSEENWSVK